MNIIDQKLPKTAYVFGALLSSLEIIGILPIFLIISEIGQQKYYIYYESLNFNLKYEIALYWTAIIFIISSMYIQYLSNKYLCNKCWDLYPKLVTELSLHLINSNIDLTNNQKYVKILITESQQYVFSVIFSKLIIFSRLVLIICAIIIFIWIAPLYTAYLLLFLVLLGGIVLPIFIKVQKQIGINREKSYRKLFESVGDIIGLRDEIFLGYNSKELMGRMFENSKKFALSSSRNAYNPQSLRVILEAVLMFGALAIAYIITSHRIPITALDHEIMLGFLVLKLLPALQAALKAVGELKSGHRSQSVLENYITKCLNSNVENIININTELKNNFEVNCELPNRHITKSFNILNKKFNVIIGKSGLGKTTVLKSIAGLSNQVVGNIMVNKVKYEFPIKWLNGFISYVPQRPHYYYSNEEYNKLSQINIIDGLFKTLKNPVEGVSGGENQRYSLARAIEANPRLLIIDEPTSALDDENFFIVMDAIHKAIKNGITVLAVSHDERLITYSDNVINFDVI